VEFVRENPGEPVPECTKLRALSHGVLMQLREKIVVSSIETVNKPMIGDMAQTTVNKLHR